ncbi:MAG: DNA damage-inducible protein D [Patescibacteria group bacterium]|jgi:DNA-damage-inducible protein D
MPNNAIVPVSLHKDFESIKKVDEQGFEYWEARELMSLLDYSRWEDFHKTIRRAQAVCASTSQSLEDHFRVDPKMIIIGKNTPREARRKIIDYQLSRFACYLIAQNGDPRKPEIAFAQTYFAVQTRKQELLEVIDDDGNRLQIRRQVASHNNRLFRTAKDAGVENFGKFNNFGYVGLYGLTASDIRKKKGISEGDILDFAGSAELAANLFRITQTNELLIRDGITGEDPASYTHFKVGQAVRETIQKLNAPMPEDRPAQEHIKDLVRRKIGQLPPKQKKLKG